MAIRKARMRIFAVVVAIYGLAVPAGALDADKFDGPEQLVVRSTRIMINNSATFQCGQRLVFEAPAAEVKRGEITFQVKSIPANKGECGCGECGCKARINDFHLYRSRRKRVDQAGYSIPDELVAKGRIGPSASRTFVVAAIHRVEVRFDYYINFDCTD